MASSSSSSSSSSSGTTIDLMRKNLLLHVQNAKTPEERAVAEKYLEFYDRNVVSSSQTPIDRTSIQAAGSNVKFYAYVFGEIAIGTQGKPTTAKRVSPILPFTMVTPSNGVSVSNDLNSISFTNAEGAEMVIYRDSTISVAAFNAKSGFKAKGGWHLFEGVCLQAKLQKDSHGRPWRNFVCSKITYWKEGPRKSAFVNLLARMFSGPRCQLFQLPQEFYPSESQVADFIMKSREELQAANTTKQINMNAVFSAQELESAHKHFIFENSMIRNPAIDPNGMAAHIHEGRSILIPSSPVFVPTEFDEPLVTISDQQYSSSMFIMKDGKAKVVETSDIYPFSYKTQVDFVQSVKTMMINMQENTIKANSLLVHGRLALGERYYPGFGIADPVTAAILLTTPITDNKIRADLFPAVISGSLDYGRTAIMNQNSSPSFVGEDKIPEYGLEIVPWRVFTNIIAGIRKTCPEVTVEFAISCINRKLRKAGFTAINQAEASIAPLVPTGKEVNVDGYCAKNNQTHVLTRKMAFNITESPIFFIKNGGVVNERMPITRGAAANFRFYIMANVIHNDSSTYHAVQEEFFSLDNGSSRKKELAKSLDEYAKVHSQEMNKIIADDVSEVFTANRAGAVPGIEFRVVYNIFAVSKELDGRAEWDAYCNFHSEEFSDEAIRKRILEIKEINAKRIQELTRSTLDGDELAALEEAEKKIPGLNEPFESGCDDTEELSDDGDGSDDDSDEEDAAGDEVLDDDDDGDDNGDGDEDLEIPDPSPPLEELIQKTKAKSSVAKVAQKPSSSTTSKKSSESPVKQPPVSTSVKSGKRSERTAEDEKVVETAQKPRKNVPKRQNRG